MQLQNVVRIYFINWEKIKITVSRRPNTNWKSKSLRAQARMKRLLRYISLYLIYSIKYLKIAVSQIPLQWKLVFSRIFFQIHCIEQQNMHWRKRRINLSIGLMSLVLNSLIYTLEVYILRWNNQDDDC